MRWSADPASGTAAAPQELPPCTSCGKGRLARDRVRTALWHGRRLVVVEDIPALVCDRCGERFYDDDTALALDRMRGPGFPPQRALHHLEVPVFAFEPARGPGGSATGDGGGNAPE